MNFSSYFILLLHQQDAVVPVAPRSAPRQFKGCGQRAAALFFCFFASV